MAASKRNNQPEDKAPRRSSRTRNEPDRFFIPVSPAKPKKSSSTKGRGRKEAAVKTAAATRAKKEKPKKAAKARKAAKKADEPKPKASRKRARQVEPDQEDEPRSKRSRVVANMPRRQIGTRAHPVSPPPSPSPEPSTKDESEEDRASTAPTEIEPEVVGTGTMPDLHSNPHLDQNLSFHGLPAALPHQVPVAPAPPAAQGAPPLVPHTPPPVPNPIFAHAATPPAQPQSPLPPIDHGDPSQVQNAILGLVPQEDEPDEHDDEPPQVLFASPLARGYAFVYLGNQQ
ncbi:hypothetical protein M407DRAFT_26598 [Tulasnella calospora MUT 4182]|uniref:Uncharacterized protein n=1 Tax=Tulasnella calospora MUT 4182 TaxID=1051891 RepID=A0A0C3QE12_9AGAM|nr:hypothetical protein M407DRAFT_26598 [Tulasnella calospora MUT 4182]